MGIKSAVGVCVLAWLAGASVRADMLDDRDRDREQDDDADRGDNVDDGDDGPKTGRPKPNDKRARAPKKDPGKTAGAKKDAGRSDAAKRDEAKVNKPGGCVDVTTDARFASVGYDHIVTLKSGCTKTMKCTVTTNVHPEPIAVELAAGGVESVVTWRGSPAREFTADVTCK
jgi:hypothetical protein